MNNSTHRRSFLKRSIALGAGLSVASLSQFAQAAPSTTTQPEPEGYFTLGKRNDHWWLITPDGKPFFTMGLNHIDPASLRYPENIEIWRKKYGGSTLRWIRESVAPNLKAWGFNTVGWVQEVTVRRAGAGLFENPGCIGFHLCGAYQRNKARRRGLLDEMEKPDQEHVDQMTAANKKIAARMAAQF